MIEGLLGGTGGGIRVPIEDFRTAAAAAVVVATAGVVLVVAATFCVGLLLLLWLTEFS